MATQLHPFEQAQVRAEEREARENLAGLRATLERVETEHSYLEGRFNATLNAVQDADARVLDANRRGGVIDFSGRAGNNGIGVPERPERLKAQIDFERARADRKLAEEAQAPLVSRMATLEHLRTRVRRAILVEEPRVNGLAEQVAAFDRQEIAATPGTVGYRLAHLGQRVAEWAAP